MNTSPLKLVSDTPEEELVIIEWPTEIVRQMRLERERRRNQEKQRLIAFGKLNGYIPGIERAVKLWDKDGKFSNFTFDNGHYGARLSIYIKRIAAWRELTPLFEAFDDAGVDANNWTNTDLPESYTRCYQNTISGEVYSSDSCGVMIYASLKAEDAECKRILVGWTKPEVYESQPIYAFDCADTPAPVETGIPAKPDDDIPF